MFLKLLANHYVEAKKTQVRPRSLADQILLLVVDSDELIIQTCATFIKLRIPLIFPSLYFAVK